MNTTNKDERRQFKKYTYRGIPLNELTAMPLSQFAALLPSSKRRRFRRGLTEREVTLLKRCALAKKNVADAYEKPRVVNTHARTMVIVPSMVGNIIGVYNGKSFVPVEIKAEMIGCYLKNFSDTKSRSTHGKPGVGATAGSKFVPLK